MSLKISPFGATLGKGLAGGEGDAVGGGPAQQQVSCGTLVGMSFNGCETAVDICSRYLPVA